MSMKPKALCPQSLTEYDLSPTRGFLPHRDPLDRLASPSALDAIAAELPKLLAARQFRRFIDSHDLVMSLDQDNAWDLDAYRYAARVLSFAGHAYVWQDPDHPADRIPAVLAVPWYQVMQKLGRPPVLSYASYALDNWRRIDPGQPVELGNVVLLQNFLGGLDEEWFVLIHIDIEAKAGPALDGLVRAQHAVSEGDIEEVTRRLWGVALAEEQMCSTLLRMREGCDPYIYYNRVRPYIHGWKDAPALPEGIRYDGVDDYHGERQRFRGETGAQSSIIPSLDAGLGVTHSEDMLTHYLLEMRQYMPLKHRAFIKAMEESKDGQGRPLLFGFVRDRKTQHPDLWKAFCECVKLLARFRETHIDYAESYIHRQSEHKKSNPTAIGTGGTPFMAYLKKHLDDTTHFIDD